MPVRSDHHHPVLPSLVEEPVHWTIAHRLAEHGYHISSGFVPEQKLLFLEENWFHSQIRWCIRLINFYGVTGAGWLGGSGISGTAGCTGGALSAPTALVCSGKGGGGVSVVWAWVWDGWDGSIGAGD